MTFWRVDPAAVRSVLATTKGDADGFEDVKAKVAVATGGAIAAAPGTQTAAALAKIANDPFGLDVEAASEHVTALVTAVGRALADFDEGDEQMAESVLRQATSAKEG